MPTFDVNYVAVLFDKKGFHNKKGNAVEFKSQGSDYRVWKPDFTSTPDGGLLISCKLDHIRGLQKDDHALIELNIDKNSLLINCSINMQYDGQKNTNFSWMADPVAGDAGRWAALIATLFTNVYNWVGGWTHDGGRLNFPAVTHHTVNNIMKCIH
jgi:hypothetical protein